MPQPDEYLSKPSATRVGVTAPFFACTRSNTGAGAAWVQVAGELDLAGAPRLAEVLRDALGEARLVVLDLRELTFLDSTGVHVIVDASIHARGDGRRLHLVHGPHRVQRVFALTGNADQVEALDSGPGEQPAKPALPCSGSSIAAA